MTKLLNATELEAILEDVASEMILNTLESTNINRQPHLVIITATEDKLVHKEIEDVMKQAELLGVQVSKMEFESNATNEEIEIEIHKLNKDTSIDSIKIYLPMFEHLNETQLINEIDFDKDIDGATLMSRGFLEEDILNFMPSISLGAILLLESYDITSQEIEGKNVVILESSSSITSSLSTTFRHLNANVITLTEKTIKEDLEFYIRYADIVISCVGQRYLLKADWFKKGSIVIGAKQCNELPIIELDFDVERVIELGNATYVSDKHNCMDQAMNLALLNNVIYAYRYNAEENFKK